MLYIQLLGTLCMRIKRILSLLICIDKGNSLDSLLYMPFSYYSFCILTFILSLETMPGSAGVSNIIMPGGWSWKESLYIFGKCLIICILTAVYGYQWSKLFLTATACTRKVSMRRPIRNDVTKQERLSNRYIYPLLKDDWLMFPSIFQPVNLVSF